MDLQNLYNYLVEKKCKDVVIYDLSKESQNYDFVVMATVSNQLNNKKLADLIMGEMGLEINPEGYNKGEWIVFDFGQVVMHLLIPQARDKYNIDKLWQSKKINFKK